MDMMDTHSLFRGRVQRKTAGVCVVHYDSEKSQLFTNYPPRAPAEQAVMQSHAVGRFLWVAVTVSAPSCGAELNTGGCC